MVVQILENVYQPHIGPSRFEGWHTEWLTTTQLGTRYDDISLSSAHKVSALEAYLRAFDYYSNAEFFYTQIHKILE